MEAKLQAIGQEHVLQGLTDAQKPALFAQLVELDTQIPGGLEQYVATAKELLKNSFDGKTAFEGFKPSVPIGDKLPLASKEFAEMEALGMSVISKAAFVLVAGGLGERLGYNGIKVSLPLYLAEQDKCFLQLYVEHILTMQAAAGGDCELPLVIMTSDDTHQLTEELLAAKNNFGMKPGQITLVKQNKVPALIDSEARFAVKDGLVETKPHGHGDVHTLLYQTGLAKKFADTGREWICFFQDTNGVIFRALPAVLGVSAKNGFDLNSVCVPRTPGEAVGAICKLEHGDGRSYTVNVEYNQLAPMLKQSDSFSGGDVADPATGTSPFPGNINCLILGVRNYLAVLDETKGMVKEFVNPKYADASKSKFKSPTRLECMMQDIPLLFPAGAKVGFTELDRLVCFSPVKNNIADAAGKGSQGLPPECAGSAERDAMLLNAQMLRMAGATVADEGPAGSFAGVPLQFPPWIVLLPSFATSPADVKRRVEGAEVSVSGRSAVVLEGDITLQGKVSVDGALVIKAAPGAKVLVKDLTVENEGWEVVGGVGDGTDTYVAMRGYTIEKRATKEFIFSEPGTHTVGNST